MPVSYKRKNTMKKSKSSKGTKLSKSKKCLTRKSKKRSVVRKMGGGADEIKIPKINDIIKFVPPHPKLGGIKYIITHFDPDNQDITDDSKIHFRAIGENVGLKIKTWQELKILNFQYINEEQV